jgi:succinoglycan biosynthesis protein ExoL
MTGIAFFGHDAGDAAVRRRVQGFLDDGLDVTGFMMRRADVVNAAWNNVDLGRTHDGAYAQRVRQVFAGARIAARHRDRLAAADLIYARNLDMLGLAFEAKRLTGLKTPVIYESLDVHRLLTRNDPIGLVFRRIEGALLARCRRLVVSSPAFLANHFETRHRGRYQAVLVENRLAAGADYGSRPEQRATPQAAGGPLRVGWMGILRCSRSLNLLLNLADQLGDRVQVVLHGVPALTEIPDFHDRIQNRPNVLFHGRYRAPEDLARIYSGVDLVWAGDFMEAGFNSVWLLPNRIYEGGLLRRSRDRAGRHGDRSLDRSAAGRVHHSRGPARHPARPGRRTGQGSRAHRGGPNPASLAAGRDLHPAEGDAEADRRGRPGGRMIAHEGSSRKKLAQPLHSVTFTPAPLASTQEECEQHFVVRELLVPAGAPPGFRHDHC